LLGNSKQKWPISADERISEQALNDRLPTLRLSLSVSPIKEYREYL